MCVRTGTCADESPEAFADHAAEFWVAAGADPGKALRLARMNVEVRNTPRAHRLLAHAVAATSTAGASHVIVIEARGTE
jgi:hypothetical protein